MKKTTRRASCALLDVAGRDPNCDTGAVLDRLKIVNSRAIDLTEALLLLSRADQAGFVPEQVDLSLVTEEATETLLPLATRHGIIIETCCDIAHTTGSPALLLQMATDLLHNGIIYNRPEGGHMRISTQARSTDVLLMVENTGDRLDPSLVATLAEPFRRGTGRVQTEDSGVGLGLAIVDRIARAHGGRLALEARTGGGLRVTVHLAA